MELHFEPVWDWPWVILAAAVSLATVLVAYRRRIAHLGRVRRTLLLGLRIVSWAVLVFLMIRPYVEFTRIDRNATVFIIAADASRSMTIKDAAGGLSRRDALLKLLDDNKKEFERLGKDIEIRLFDFHKELIAVDKFRPDAPGEQTAIGYVLDSLPRE